MQDSNSSGSDPKSVKKEYNFGGIQEFSLEKIEDEILNESLYLDVFAGSDIAFKQNVNSLENVLPALLNIRCITYDYKTQEFTHKNFPEGHQVGVIAQDVANHFPELVKADSEGKLHVNYSQLSTVAIQAVKELSDVLSKTNERLDRLEKEIAKLKSN